MLCCSSVILLGAGKPEEFSDTAKQFELVSSCSSETEQTTTIQCTVKKAMLYDHNSCVLVHFRSPVCNVKWSYTVYQKLHTH